MLNVTLVGLPQLIGRLQAMPDSVRTTLAAKVEALTLKLQARVVRDKLSGQVLGVRSGNLRRSIQQRTETTGSAVYGFVYSSGDVKYAAFWEFGFHGDMAVRAYERRGSVVFGKTVSPFTALVSAHTRHVNQDARPFLRPALADMSEEIRVGMRQAVVDGLRKQAMGAR